MTGEIGETLTEDSNTQFKYFYGENYLRILNVCSRRLGNQSDAEDAASEIFEIAWLHCQNGVHLSLPWIYVVARNVIGNFYRGRRRLSKIDVAVFEVARLAAGDSPGDTERVHIALRRLRVVDRELLFMFYWRDLSGAEIAGILGCSASAVWLRLSRARSALRQLIEEETF